MKSCCSTLFWPRSLIIVDPHCSCCRVPDADALLYSGRLRCWRYCTEFSRSVHVTLWPHYAECPSPKNSLTRPDRIPWTALLTSFHPTLSLIPFINLCLYCVERKYSGYQIFVWVSNENIRFEVPWSQKRDSDWMFLMYVHKIEQTDWTDCVKIYKTCILGQNVILMREHIQYVKKSRK